MAQSLAQTVRQMNKLLADCRDLWEDIVTTEMTINTLINFTLFRSVTRPVIPNHRYLLEQIAFESKQIRQIEHF